MKIRCETNREVRVALAQLEKQGVMWNGSDRKQPTEYGIGMKHVTLIIDNKNILTWSHYRHDDAVEASKLYANLLR